MKRRLIGVIASTQGWLRQALPSATKSALCFGGRAGFSQIFRSASAAAPFAVMLWKKAL